MINWLLPLQDFVTKSGCEFVDETKSGSRGEDDVVSEHDPEMTQPTDFPVIPQKVEVRNACRNCMCN